MKKKILLILSLIGLIFFSSTTAAIMWEGGTSVNSGGLVTYVRWFEDYSGLLIVSSNFANNSGIVFADITVVAVCTDETRVFKLRAYDSDTDSFLEPENDEGIGEKERRIQVQPHEDKNNLTCLFQVTSLDASEIFAQIVLYYTYDENAEYDPVIDDPKVIDPTEYKKERTKLILRAWAWLIQTVVSILIALPVGVKLTNRFYGAG